MSHFIINYDNFHDKFVHLFKLFIHFLKYSNFTSIYSFNFDPLLIFFTKIVTLMRTAVSKIWISFDSCLIYVQKSIISSMNSHRRKKNQLYPGYNFEKRDEPNSVLWHIFDSHFDLLLVVLILIHHYFVFTKFL